MNKTIEFTEEEWEELLDWISLRSDESYANRIAELIETKLKSLKIADSVH
jgi:hypothetical protein